mgnify:CR=1 FL=1
MPYFRNTTIQGVTYELDHLDPFTFPFFVDDENFIVSVEFTNHCFTEKREPRHTPDHHYTSRCKNGEQRTFSPQRFEDSKLLPNMIKTLGNASVYHTDRESFFFMRTAQGDQYLVFFRAYKSTKEGVDVRLNINSAYRKPRMTQRASPVKFTNLVKSTAQSLPLTAGPKARISRG